MTLEQKRTYWHDHIEVWQQSGITQKSYCKQHSLKPSSFAYWRRAHSAKSKSKSKSSRKLIPVAVTYPQTVTLTLAASLQLDVPVTSLDQVLPMVLQALREAS